MGLGGIAFGGIAFGVIALSVLFEGVCSSCLLSRMRCTYRYPARTAKPGNNEVGVYTTKYGKGDSCEILRRRHRVKALPRISSDGGTIFYLYSPGKRYSKSQNYPNQCLMVANVNCTTGQFIYFQLLDMHLENTKCYDARTGGYECVDYLQVRTPRGDVISENCGRDISNLNGVILPYDSIQVVFRSNHQLTYPGFSATATCFSPSPPPKNCVSQQRTSARHPAPVNQCQASNHEEIIIPYGHYLVFNGRASYSTLNVVNRQTNAVTNRYHKPTITTLQFLSMDGSTQNYENRYTQGPQGPEGPRGYSFYGSQYAQSIPSIIIGPGIFYVPRKGISKQSCFQNYLMDVSKYLPTEEEKGIIKSQNQALEATIPREEPLLNDEDLDYDLDTVPVTLGTISIFKPIKVPTYNDYRKHLQVLLPQKRVAPSSKKQTDLIDQPTLLSAVINDRDCNVILRVSSGGLVALLSRENPAKLTSLQQQASLQRS